MLTRCKGGILGEDGYRKQHNLNPVGCLISPCRLGLVSGFKLWWEPCATKVRRFFFSVVFFCRSVQLSCSVCSFLRSTRGSTFIVSGTLEVGRRRAAFIRDAIRASVSRRGCKAFERRVQALSKGRKEKEPSKTGPRERITAAIRRLHTARAPTTTPTRYIGQHRGEEALVARSNRTRDKTRKIRK